MTPERRAYQITEAYSQTIGAEAEPMIAQDIATAIREATRLALESAAKAKPAIAENPDVNAYERGYADGIIHFAAAIRALADDRGTGGAVTPERG